MEDLKENTQKKIMEKLVLSAALGMFCYCSNNVTMGMKTNAPVLDTLIKENDGDNPVEQGHKETLNLKDFEGSKDSPQTQDNSSIKQPAKTEEEDEECCPCCCCCEETKPKEEGEVIKKSGDITVKEDINQKEMRPIIRDGNDNFGGETK